MRSPSPSPSPDPRSGGAPSFDALFAYELERGARGCSLSKKDFVRLVETVGDRLDEGNPLDDGLMRAWFDSPMAP